MKIYQLLAAACLIGTTACNSNNVYETHLKDFPKHRWSKAKVLEYTPEITDTAALYNVSLELRHVFGFQFSTMKTKVKRTTPSGTQTTNDYDFAVFGKDKQYLSNCSEDICDLRVVVEENVKFSELGKYQYAVSHEMEVDDLPNVMEFGLVIDKVETQQ